jgi:hypothetical protein
MLFSDPLLRRTLPGSRGQEHLSLNGAIGTGKPDHFDLEPLGPATHPGASQGGAPFRQYDPIVASYESNTPKYSPPAPWFTGMTHLSSPPETTRPDWPPPDIDRQDPVRYHDSLMTPGIFQHLLEEVSTAGPLPIAARLTLPEIMSSTAAASTPEVRSAESMLAAPKLLDEHPLFSPKPIASDPYAAMMPQAAMPREVFEQGVCKQQQQPGLEAVVQGAMPLQKDDPLERERRLHGQQIQNLEQLMNTLMLPGFGPRA